MMNHDERAMNDDEPRDDSALTAELVDSLAEVAVPERPPLAAITDRGRVHRRRRLAGFAGLGGTGAVAVIALVLGLTGVVGAAPAAAPGRARPQTSPSPAMSTAPSR